jgi:hypothetical protein
MKTRMAVAFLVFTVLGLGVAWCAAADGAVPGWVRVNHSGFDNPGNQVVSCLLSFNGQLHAGTSNYEGGAQLWSRGADLAWTAVTTDGFGTPTNTSIEILAAFKNQLYAGTENEATGGEVWRTSPGQPWARVVERGFGNAANAGVHSLIVFKDALYATTASYDPTHNLELWRTTTGNRGDWTKKTINGLDVHNALAPALEVFNGYLYLGTNSFVAGPPMTTTGGEVWRSSDGTAWTQVNADGFGTIDNATITSLTAFNSYLYAGTNGSQGHGAEVWRCQTCSRQSDWSRVVEQGFGDASHGGTTALAVYNGRLYAAVGSSANGLSVWSTANGTDWEALAAQGFGGAGNRGPYWGERGWAVHNNQLYLGTINFGHGGEVWLFLPNRVYLPVLRRS